MSTSRMLPISEPDILSYAHQAFYLSVLYNDPDAMKWVYSNFVQLYMSPAHTYIDYYTPNPEYYLNACIFSSDRITRNTLIQFIPNIVDFVRKQIDNGFYFWAYVNDYYVPGTQAYQHRSYSHALMIHGYDDRKQIFHISGYFAKQNYGISTISYELLEKAFLENEVSQHLAAQQFVFLIKLDERMNSLIDFKLHWVMEQLDEYLHSKPSSERLSAMEVRTDPPRIFGMKIYDELQRQIRLELQTDNRRMLDHRPYYVLWEHKKLMNRRLEYMSEHGHFQFSSSVLVGYKEIEALALTIRNMKFKYLMTSQDKFLEQIDTRLEELKSLETNVIANMLEQYSEHSGISLPKLKEETR
jgi:hypothetical protein